jgi:hypothetical protein
MDCEGLADWSGISGVSQARVASLECDARVASQARVASRKFAASQARVASLECDAST